MTDERKEKRDDRRVKTEKRRDRRYKRIVKREETNVEEKKG